MSPTQDWDYNEPATTLAFLCFLEMELSSFLYNIYFTDYVIGKLQSLLYHCNEMTDV